MLFKILVLFYEGPLSIFANSILPPLRSCSPPFSYFLFSAIIILSSGQLILYFISTKYINMLQVSRWKQSIWQKKNLLLLFPLESIESFKLNCFLPCTLVTSTFPLQWKGSGGQINKTSYFLWKSDNEKKMGMRNFKVRLCLTINWMGKLEKSEIRENDERVKVKEM